VKNGDLSNEVVRRILVNLDVVLYRKPEITKLLGVIPRTRIVTSYNIAMLNTLWRFRDRVGVSMECFVCTQDQDWDPDVMSEVEEHLDNYGTNPFNYFTTYARFEEVQAILPYRNEVVGIVDPERAWFYGSKAVDLDRLI
jgi:hypothetical protein